MLFSSLEFLLLFLPVTAVVYFFIPKGAKNIWLLITSLFFYAWGEPRFVLIMIASILFNYFAARLVEKSEKGGRKRKLFLVMAIVFDLSLLFFFKYLTFAAEILHDLFSGFPVIRIALPIGISFFTFQAMSYVIDVYRGIPAQRNICSLGLYISFFPQLIAGPIVRYTTVMEQIQERTVTRDDISEGIKRFIIGFNKKLLLANILAEAADAAYASPSLSVCMGWLGLVCYTLQIYFDFSAYSDMAIGLFRCAVCFLSERVCCYPARGDSLLYTFFEGFGRKNIRQRRKSSRAPDLLELVCAPCAVCRERVFPDHEFVQSVYLL